MLKNIKSFINDKKDKLSLMTGNALLVGGVSQLAAMATADPATSIVSSVVKVILDIFKWIGVLLLCWSVGMLVLAFKNEDADSKSRAMMMMVVSIALIGLGALLGPVLNTANVGIAIE